MRWLWCASAERLLEEIEQLLQQVKGLFDEAVKGLLKGLTAPFSPLWWVYQGAADLLTPLLSCVAMSASFMITGLPWLLSSLWVPFPKSKWLR